MTELIKPFEPFLDALKSKDAELFAKLGWMSPGQFWREWQKVYPEDFALGDQSPAHPSSIVPKRKAP